jgi:hypothetical protein
VAAGPNSRLFVMVVDDFHNIQQDDRRRRRWCSR